MVHDDPLEVEVMTAPKDPLARCANGCDAPVSPPSKVICRACIDRITAKLERLVAGTAGTAGTVPKDPLAVDLVCFYSFAERWGDGFIPTPHLFPTFAIAEAARDATEEIGIECSPILEAPFVFAARVAAAPGPEPHP